MLQEANNTIIKLVQNKHFSDEVQKIKQKKDTLGKESQLLTLNQFIEKYGIITVDGRIRWSGLSDRCNIFKEKQGH